MYENNLNVPEEEKFIRMTKQYQNEKCIRTWKMYQKNKNVSE